METTLTENRIKKDNPHFIGNDMKFVHYKVGTHWCCDVTCLSRWPDGKTGVSKASYEYFDEKWVLIAN